MKSRQTLFFATRSDLDPIVKRLEENSVFHYFEIGLFGEIEIWLAFGNKRKVNDGI